MPFRVLPLEDEDECMRLEYAGKERRMEREERAVAASCRPAPPTSRRDIVEDGVRKGEGSVGATGNQSLPVDSIHDHRHLRRPTILRQ